MMINRISTALIISNITILAIVGYLMFWPVPLTKIYNEPYPVTPSQVEPGETITYPVIFEKFINYRVKTVRTLICDNGRYQTLSTSISEAPTGYHEIVGSIVIPNDMPPGNCYVQFNSDAEINPLRVEELDSRTANFEII